MTIEQQQVNVTELQRLNEAILLTMDAIRRVVPQLAQAQSQSPGMGTQGIDPLTAAYLHGQTQTLRAIFGQTQSPMGMQYGQPGMLPFGMQGYGQHPLAQLGQVLFGQHPFAQHPFAQHPFAQQQVGQQQPWSWQQQVGQSPFAGFSVGQQWPSPVSYSGIGGLGVGGLGGIGVGGLGGVGGGVGNAQRPF